MPPNIITPQDTPMNDQPKPSLEPPVINPPVAKNYTPDISPQVDNPVPEPEEHSTIEHPVPGNTGAVSSMPGIDQTVSPPTLPSSSPSPSVSSQQPMAMPNTTSTAMSTDMLATLPPEMPSAEMPPAATMPTTDSYNNIADTPFVTPGALNAINTNNPKSRHSLSIVVIIALIVVGIAGVIIWLVLK